ncbi:NUDIX hydrolase [Litorimonas sp. RW-G-Af-16]|uniref:NUDIX hydrolase n=1 Tax=Litorimonas sp. RW-G-Af-16 TaxID=3241168 RepID=UPI00390CC67F
MRPNSKDPIRDSGPVLVGKMKITDQERAKRKELSHAPRPKIASTIVLTCGPKDNPKILMGQRSSKHDFMPSVYVFPGGRVDRADSYAPFIGDLSARTERILEAANSPRKSRAIVLAAIRETWEETGLLLGRAAPQSRNINHASYDAFRNKGILPDLTGVEVFGRAVTPPHRHKRFDAWFFIKHLGNVPPPTITDSHELLNVGWFTLGQIKRELELQRATTMMIRVLEDFLAADRLPNDIFYSRALHGEFQMTRFPE